MLAACSGGPAPFSFPDVAGLPANPQLPDPLVFSDGRPVRTKEEWVSARRPELKALFQHYMYGAPPPAPAGIKVDVRRSDPKFMGGKATLKDLSIAFGPPAAPVIDVLLIVPNQRKGPAPVFLGINFYGNHCVTADPGVALPRGWLPRNGPGVKENRATDAGRGAEAEKWQVEMIVDRGYALATFYHGDLDPDRNDFTDGIHPHYYKPGQTSPGPHEWGAIAAWAWGFSRVMDYLVTDKEIDPKRIALFGHSRNGKTALLAAAMDERAALAIPHQAGCGGTAPSRGKVGEQVKQINDRFPHWFNDTFPKFNDQVDRLPFDQHSLVALCAPRPVLLSNAVEDSWANPDGQFEVLKAADPVYRLLGAGGLEAREKPEVGKLEDSTLGCFIRPGKHSVTAQDWKAFLDFADRRLGR